MFDMIKGIFGIILLITVVSILVMAPIVGLCVAFEQGQCRTLSALSPDKEYKWVFWGGCLVKTESGYWVNSDSVYQNNINLSGE